MSFKLQELRDDIKAILRDDAPNEFISQVELDSAINQAIRQLNHDKPLTLAKDIPGDGTQDYPLPSEFKKGFSDVSEVESPAGQNPPVFRKRADDWFLYEDPTQSPNEQQRLRFKLFTPTVNDVIRVTIKTTHTVDLNSSTLDQDSAQAVIYKSLTLLLFSLANRFNQSNNPTLSADSVDYAARSQNFLFASERFKSLYKQITGLGEGVKAAQASAEADIIFSHGEDLLWHPQRSR